MFEDEIVIQVGPYDMLRYHLRSGEGVVVKGMVKMEHLSYHNPNESNKGMLVTQICL